MSDIASSPSPATGKIEGKTIASWIIQILLVAAFLAAGAAKLAGVPMMVQVFDQIGLGQGFRYVTAIVEIFGAILLLVPGVTALGALLLGTTMIFAVLTHVLILHSNPGGAVVLFVLSLTVLWLRRSQLAGLRDRLL